MSKLTRPYLLYERITTFKNIPSWIVWITIGLTGYLASEFAVSYFQEQDYPIVRIFFGLTITTWPIIFIWFFHSFNNTMHAISELFWDNQDDFEIWLSKKQADIFSLKTNAAKVITLLVFVLGPLTFVFIGLPLKTPLLNASAIIGFSLISFIGGHYAYVLAMILATLNDLSKQRIRVPFYRLPHPGIAKLQSYYSLATFFTTYGYICLVIATRYSPFGFSPSLLVWLTVLGCYPVIMLIWTFYKTHIIIKNAKQTHLDLINKQIQSILKQIEGNSNLKNEFELLEKAMDIQSKVQNISEQPIAFSGVITFLVSAVTAIGQILISVMSLFRR